jgi:predicted dienelactone hydrolase
MARSVRIEIGDWMRRARFVIAAAAFCMSTAMGQAAGLQLFEVPADAGEPALATAVWYPCAALVADVRIGTVPVRAAQDCPVTGSGLPLVVISHGYSGKLTSHHDTAEILANAGFVVAAINHPIDSGPDMSRADTVAMLVERPRDTSNG